jgi:hypothetical protein
VRGECRVESAADVAPALDEVMVRGWVCEGGVFWVLVEDGAADGGEALPCGMEE